MSDLLCRVAIDGLAKLDLSAGTFRLGLFFDPLEPVVLAKSGRTDTASLADTDVPVELGANFSPVGSPAYSRAVSVHLTNKMTAIPPFDVLARNYGAEIVRFRGLSTISMACKVDRAVDIGFTSRRQSLLALLFRSAPRFEIAQGVFAYGPGATSASEFISADDSLRVALSLLLSSFRCSVEWSGNAVSVRVSSGVVDADATGGQRFLSNLALIAERLNAIGNKPMVIDRRREGYGPLLIRKITLTACFVTPLIVLLAVRYWVRRG